MMTGWCRYCNVREIIWHILFKSVLPNILFSVKKLDIAYYFDIKEIYYWFWSKLISPMQQWHKDKEQLLSLTVLEISYDKILRLASNISTLHLNQDSRSRQTKSAIIKSYRKVLNFWCILHIVTKKNYYSLQLVLRHEIEISTQSDAILCWLENLRTAWQEHS